MKLKITIIISLVIAIERRIHIWEVSDKYFAGKPHRKPLDISDEKLQQKCKAVDY